MYNPSILERKDIKHLKELNAGTILSADCKRVPVLGWKRPFSMKYVLTTKGVYVIGKEVSSFSPDRYSTVKEIEVENCRRILGFDFKKTGDLRTTTSLDLKGKDKVLQDLSSWFRDDIVNAYTIYQDCLTEGVKSGEVIERVLDLYFNEKRCKNMTTYELIDEVYIEKMIYKKHVKNPQMARAAFYAGEILREDIDKKTGSALNKMIDEYSGNIGVEESEEVYNKPTSHAAGFRDKYLYMPQRRTRRPGETRSEDIDLDIKIVNRNYGDGEQEQ